MRFPRRSRQRDMLVLSWNGQALAYVFARPESGGRFRIQKLGLELVGEGGQEALLKRLPSLGFKGLTAMAVLRAPQYQILQIDAPSVPPEELRTAVRWQIRDLVDVHVDDLTLDVLKVGDDKVRATGSLFVVVAQNTVIREVLEIGQAMRCTVQVVDIQDLAQRNLQTAFMQQAGISQRAHAALVLGDDDHALLTISANAELFYSRRIDLGGDFIRANWDERQDMVGVAEASALSLSPESGTDSERTQRLVVEVQRSLDLWDRTWPMLPLDRLSVHAGDRSAELAGWLGRELGQAVNVFDVSTLFPGFEKGDEETRRACWPLLGALLRNAGRP